LVWAFPANAQTNPGRPIRVVPFAAGSVTDVIGHLENSAICKKP
jgi:tripartite-type tricarboxylate transporter receptor subunit TctC